jgi:hypothetical protein
MTESAAHLADEVLPPVPVRQWVLTLPTGCGTSWRGIRVSAARCSGSMPGCCSTTLRTVAYCSQYGRHQ